MPPLPSPSTWRTHPQSQDVRLFILTPEVVIQRAINQASFTYPVYELTYDNPGGNPGSFTDVQAGQTLAIYDSTGDTLKGLVRVRVAPDADTLYISPTSEGDIQFADNDVLQVWDEYRLWDKMPRLAPDGTTYKDWDIAFPGAAAAQPPVANAGCWVAEACAVGGTISVPFDGTNSFAVAEGATITTYLWDVADGSFTSGNSGSSSPTVSFPAGFRWVSLTVTDSNGNTHTTHVLVVADDGTYGTQVTVSRLSGTVENGWEGSFALWEDDLSSFPTGACVILWAVETYGNTQGSLNGPTGRQQVKFSGWLVEELDTIEPLLSDVVVNAQNALALLGHLPAFSMTTEYAPTPAEWAQIANMTMWRQAHYLMQWHSTLLDVCAVERPSYYASYPYPRLNATEGMLDEQLQFVANAVGARVTCDQRGMVYWRKNPQLMTAAERAAVSTVVTLADTDWEGSLPFRKRHHNQVSVVRAIAGISNQTDVSTIAAVAPGASPGAEGGQEQLPNLLVFSQDDLNERLGRYYAWKNLLIPELPMSVFLQGMINDPAWQEYAYFTLNADSNRRGLAIENQPYLLNALDVTFNHEWGTSNEQWAMETLTAETGIASALTQQLPGAEPPDSGPYLSSDGFYIDPLVTDPYTGPDWFSVPPPDYANVAPFEYVPNDVSTPSNNDANAYFAWNTNFARTFDPASAGPSWVVIDGTMVYADANTSSHCWDLTNNSLRFSSNPMDAVPLFVNKQAVENGRLLRALAGVTGAVGIYRAPLADGTWPHTFDFTTSDEDWVLNPSSPFGTWTSGQGWTSTLNGGNQQTNIQFTMPAPAKLTSMTGFFNIANAAPTLANIGLSVQYIGSTTITGAAQPPYSAGANSRAVSGDNTGVTTLRMSLSTANASTGASRWTSAEIEGEGFNPFDTYDDVFVNYCTDNGDVMTELEVGPFVGDSGYDVDDFALGVHLAAADHGIHYTDSYTGTFTELTGLTGLDGVMNVTCIRIPYRKIASQALNNVKTSLQFIFGTNAAVSGATLWAVTFDATTGTILAQIDITPIISATTYYVIGPDALETYGGNTRRIKAFVKPVGGGNTRLIGSDDGAGTWTSRNTGFDGVSIFHLPPNLGGNGQKIIVAGDDGIASSINGGTTLTDRTGDYDTETGSGEASGVFAL